VIQTDGQDMADETPLQDGEKKEMTGLPLDKAQKPLNI